MTTTIKTINVGNDFTPFPGGRVISDGPFSGEAFRQDFLIGPLSRNEKIHIIIDTAMGYGSSFLEECFGGLVRSGYTPEFLKENIKFVYSDSAYSFYEEEIWKYIKEASA